MSRINRNRPEWKGKLDYYNVRKLLEDGWRLEDIPLRVVYYTRVSTDKFDQQNSLENQKSYFEEYITNVDNWTLTGSYFDEGVTGTSTRNRDGFNQMFQDAINGEFDLIMMKEVSRFARNTLDCIFYARELKKANVNIYFKNDMFSYFENSGEESLEREASNAQKESRRLSERVKFGFERSIKKGVVLGNDNIWGYVKDKGKLVVVQEEADIVRRIFELYSQGYGCRRIGKILHEKWGYVASKGNVFGYNTISNIITNPKYKGVYVGGKTQKIELLSNKIMHFDKSDWTVWDDETGETVPRIVSDKLWDECNAMFKQRSDAKKNNDASNYSNLYTYSGKIFCGSDGSTYWHRTYKYKSGNKTVWQCREYCKYGVPGCDNPHIYAHELNFVMDNVIKCLFDNKDELWNKLQAIYTSIISSINYDNEIKSVIGKIEMLRKKKDKLLMYNVSGDISDKEFKEMNKDINEQTNNLENELKRYESINDGKKANESMLKLTMEWFNSDRQYTNERREELIGKFLDSVTIHRTNIENSIILDIRLKSGINIPSFLKKNKDNSLPQSMHITSDKLTLPRYVNMRQEVPTQWEFTYNAHIIL